MKKHSLRLVVLLMALFFAGQIEAGAQSFDNIANAIKGGNASSLAASFGANVEITIKDVGNSYSKNQGEMVLKNFFSTHHPKSFSIAHQGTSPEGSKYFIGKLSTSAGNYRAYVYSKTTNGKLVIQEIRFEEQ